LKTVGWRDDQVQGLEREDKPSMSARTSVRLEETRPKLAAIHGLIAPELAAAERIFREELGSRFPFVQGLVDHCARYQGKRLRPTLVLLSGLACGELTPAHPVLAAVVEMIHVATLVHDDILDESVVRRHAATVNSEWGNESAVLLGDFLFTHAFHLAASLESTRACRWIGRATNRVCEGELLQVHHRGNLDLGEAEYFQIIEGKTAELTAVSCKLGAAYADSSEELTSALEAFGWHLGIAFQIADDVLDIWGEERQTGKSLGTDLEKQKLTLPLIRLLAHCDAEAVLEARTTLQAAHAEDRRRLQPLMERTGALEDSWETARDHVEQALRALDPLPPSEARSALTRLAQLILRRSS